MMKIKVLIYIFTLCNFSMYSQNHVFVMVDVSQSVKQSELDDARQALSEILTGQLPSKAFIPTGLGHISDLPKFKLEQGDKFALVKFGSLNTTISISPNPITIKDVNADVFQVLSTIEWIPTDQQTYITLAKAKIAEYAKNHNISKYKLYILSDNINDDYGQGGKPSYPDNYTRNLAEGYNTSTYPVIEAGYTKLKFSANSDFTISLIPGVDVSKYSLPSGTPPSIVDADTGNAVITITSPPKARKGNEHKINTEILNVNWTCRNCPLGIKYTVIVSQFEGGRFRETKRDLSANTATFKLPDGKFRLTISASNYNASSDYTNIHVSTGNYGFLIFLVILIGAGSIAYYFWNKKRQEKIDGLANIESNDIFSKGSGGTSSNSSNSDYF